MAFWEIVKKSGHTEQEIDEEVKIIFLNYEARSTL
jgi:hypothetical protein